MSTNAEQEISRLHRVYKTLHEMLRDRGYLVAKEEIDRSLEQFKAEYAPGGTIDRSRLCFFTNLENEENEQIYIYFAEEKNVSLKEFRKFIMRITDQGFNRGILIYSTKINNLAEKAMKDVRDQCQTEAFPESSLIVNITKHVLVPKHEVLSQEAVNALLARYLIRRTQLPQILLGDPVARYLGLVRGQVVKITRPSETSGRYASYRVCI